MLNMIALSMTPQGFLQKASLFSFAALIASHSAFAQIDKNKITQEAKQVCVSELAALYAEDTKGLAIKKEVDSAWQTLRLKAAASTSSVPNINIFYQEYAQERRLSEAKQKTADLRQLPESSISNLHDQVSILKNDSESLVYSKGQRSLEASMQINCALDRKSLLKALRTSDGNQSKFFNFTTLTNNLNTALDLPGTVSPAACLEATSLALQSLETSNVQQLVDLFIHRSALAELAKLSSPEASSIIGQDMMTLDQKCKSSFTCKRYPEVASAVQAQLAKLENEKKVWSKLVDRFSRSVKKSEMHYLNISQMRKIIGQLNKDKSQEELITACAIDYDVLDTLKAK